MPSPASSAEFVELVRKSGVVEDKRLTAYAEKMRAANGLAAGPAALAGKMVADGLLTRFQAEQFMQGRWRRFFIGKYKVLEPIGSGGMGTVYLCEHKLMRRRVAVKVLPSAKNAEPAAIDRFYREARAVAALDHPNIVRAYDIDQDDKLHFLVMEHVDGSNLQEILKKTGPMDSLRACHYIRQAALGLQHAHEKAGLVHRDIKPGNILVDRYGVVKVLDMGLARFFFDDEDTLTKKYDENVLGTADYLAPEQALDSHGVDIRADIYSLGATFYFCLTGRTPFPEGSVAQKLIWHQTRQPKPIKTLRPEVPDAVVAIVEKMMAKDVSLRFRTPQAVADALAPLTATVIPPPADIEMPQFSAASLGTGAENAPTGGSSRPSAKPESAPAARKNWQVANRVQGQSSPPPTPGSGKATGPSAALSAPKSPPPKSPAPKSPPVLPKAGAALAQKTTSGASVAVVAARPSAAAAKPVPALAPLSDAAAWDLPVPDTEDLSARVDTSRNPRRQLAPRRIASINPGRTVLPSRRPLWLVLGGCAVLLIVVLLFALLR